MSVLAALTILVGVASAASSYGPVYQICPATTIRRVGTPQQGNQTLNPQEAAYVANRQKLIPASLTTYLGSRAATVYGGDISAASPPVIALSISGGGDRAALYGAGVVSALDGRDAAAMATGTGGLLQSATYISALSGGSWYLTSLIFNGLPQSMDLVLGNNATGLTGWNLVDDLFSPGSNTADQQSYVSQIMSDLALKSAAGFNVTFGDYWARALSYHFLPTTTQQNFFTNTTSSHGTNFTLSTAPLLPIMMDYQLPFPIILADVYSVNTNYTPLAGADVPIQNVVYEFTPYEFGSYDPALSAFIATNIVGTSVKNGNPYGNTAGSQCVSGFDNAGFIMGISSNLFNEYNRSASPTWTSPLSPVNAAWKLINSTFYNVQPNQQLDISAVPNPFQGLSPSTYQDTNEVQLRLLDGGLDDEVDPVSPFLVPARGVDIILVVDGSADSDYHRPQGASLVATQLRDMILPNGTVSTPPLPKTTDTYIAYGLATRPTFFGCLGTPAKLNGSPAPKTYPMMVYLPNYDNTSITNTSTAQLVYPDTESTAFITTAHDSTLQGIPTASGGADPMWATALACAVVERTRGRMGIDQTATCTSLFASYCWNGTEVALSTNSSGAGSAGSSVSTAAGSASTSATSPTVKSAATLRVSLGFAGVVGIAISALSLVLV